MENASKALIIAGAILVAILLISIAVIIVNQGKGITSSSEELMKAQELQMFNAQFTPYEGRKKGAELKGLINVVNASNAVHANDGLKVELRETGQTTPLTSLSFLVPSAYYNVGIVYRPR